MPRGPIPHEEYPVFHKKMLDLQKEIYPFSPTTRELMDTWGYKTTSAVTNTLDHLIEKGMVVARKNGNRRHFYALEKPIPPYLAVLMDQAGNVSR